MRKYSENIIENSREELRAITGAAPDSLWYEATKVSGEKVKFLLGVQTRRYSDEVSEVMKAFNIKVAKL